MECHFNHISPHTQIVFIKWKFFNRCILYKHGCPPHLIDTMIWPANVPPFMLYLWGCPLHFIEIMLLWNGQGSPPWADSRGMFQAYINILRIQHSSDFVSKWDLMNVWSETLPKQSRDRFDLSLDLQGELLTYISCISQGGFAEFRKNQQ